MFLLATCAAGVEAMSHPRCWGISTRNRCNVTVHLPSWCPVCIDNAKESTTHSDMPAICRKECAHQKV